MRGSSLMVVPLAVSPVAALVMVVRMAGDRITPTPGMQGRDEREGPITLDELGEQQREGFKNVLGALRSLDQRVGYVEERLHDVESQVFSDPPPPMGVRRARLARRRASSLHSRTQENSGDVAELTGRIIALEAKTDTTVAINKQQSKSMGLAMPDATLRRKFVAFLFSRAGLEFVVAVAGLMAAAAGYKSATDASQRAQDVLRHMPAVQEVAPR